MRLETVKLCDVYPDEANPRDDMGDLEALAASFDANAERPGEPFNPPMLRRDGGIYRIVDGERRWRAMELRGTKEFQAIVAADEDDELAMLAMIATDRHKKPLEEVELSRGFQRVLSLGVDPETVDRAANFKGAAKVARARRAAGERAEEMSLDWLLAVDELADDPEAQAELVSARPSDWRWQASSIKSKMRRKRQAAELHALVDEMLAADPPRIVVFPSQAEAREAGYKTTCMSFSSPKDLLKREESDGFAGAYAWNPSDEYLFQLAAADAEPEIDPKVAEAAAALHGASERVLADAAAWFGSRLAATQGRGASRAGQAFDAAGEAFRFSVVVENYTWDLLENEEGPFAGVTELKLSSADYAFGYLAWEPGGLSFDMCRRMLQGDVTDYQLEQIVGFADWLDAMEATGFPKSADADLLRPFLEKIRSGEEAEE